MSVQLDDAHAQALAELAKGKVSDLMKARDEAIQKIAEWERICSALAGIHTPAQTEALQTPSEDPVQHAALVADLTPAKSMGRFPYEKAQYYLIEKTILWVFGDVMVVGRVGYGDKRVKIQVALLQSLDEKKISSYANDNMRAILRGLLREVDYSLMPPKAKEAPPLKEPLAVVDAVQKTEKKDPEKDEKKDTPPQEEEPEKPKLEFFHEDTGFDYMAVQPKQVGRTQVYSNPGGKMVIKVAREIVLTTKDMIEKLKQYDEKDLTASIRGISSQKQNILRVYLTELRAQKKKLN